MLKLYFGSTASTISTVLILLFGVIFVWIINKRNTITNWGTLVIVLLFYGLFMSIMSGTKDGMGTAAQLIANNHWSMIVLGILGGLAFLIGIVAIFIRHRAFWGNSVYVLSSIIIIKTLLTEGIRLANHFTRLT